MVEKSSTEVIQSSLIVVHHHVTLSSFVVCVCKLRIVHNCVGEAIKCFVELLLL